MADGKLIGALLRMGSALFAKGGDIKLPAQPARPEPQVGPVTGVVTPAMPAQPELTVTVPHGIARDPTVLILFFAGLVYRGLGLFGIELPFTAEDLEGWVSTAVPVVAGIIARIKSKNITRG